MGGTGTVEQVSWSRLQVRGMEPPAVLKSIPPEDMHSFLRLLARNPLSPFPDAFTLMNRVTMLRNAQAVSRLAELSGEFHRRFDNVDGGSSKKKRGASSAGEIDGNGNEISDGMAAKRPRRQSSRRQTAFEMDLTEGAEKQAASGRVSRTSGGGRSQRQRQDLTKIGPDHQVDPLPPRPVMQRRMVGDRYVPVDSVDISSTLVFTCSKSGPPLETFLTSLRSQVEARDGFPPSPWNEERALGAWMEANGNVDKAMKLALQKIRRHSAYPGEWKPWTPDEEMTFAAFIGQEFDTLEVMFRHMSRSVLPSRSVRELVLHWYTGYRPMGRESSTARGHMVDHGVESSPRLAMEPETMADCLRSLAVTAGDGFPPERRMRNAVLETRDDLRTNTRARRMREHATKKFREALGMH